MAAEVALVVAVTAAEASLVVAVAAAVSGKAVKRKTRSPSKQKEEEAG